jgi:hypothetical protein
VHPLLGERHVERRQDQFRPQVRLHRPTDHTARVNIEHHRQIQKARPRRYVRDVGQRARRDDGTGEKQFRPQTFGYTS